MPFRTISGGTVHPICQQLPSDTIGSRQQKGGPRLACRRQRSSILTELQNVEALHIRMQRGRARVSVVHGRAGSSMVDGLTCFMLFAPYGIDKIEP